MKQLRAGVEEANAATEGGRCGIFRATKKPEVKGVGRPAQRVSGRCDFNIDIPIRAIGAGEDASRESNAIGSDGNAVSGVKDLCSAGPQIVRG